MCGEDYTYDDLDVIFQSDEKPEEIEIDLCDIMRNGPEEEGDAE